MTSAPVVDFVIPYWGDPALARETIDSVRAQNRDEWTLTVIDDGWPDSTIGDLLSGDPDDRIRYRRNPSRLGVVGNFRRSVQSARSDWLVLLGSDDLVDPGYVAALHRVIREHPVADIVQPGVRVIDEVGREVRPLVDRVKHRLAPRAATTLSGETLAASLLRGAWYYWPSLAFRRSSIQRHDFRDDFPIVLDLAILIDMALDGAVLVSDPEVVFSYRRHSASASQESLLDGSRFEGDRRYFALAQALSRRAGWSRARRAASVRLISRLHAIAAIPALLRRPTRAGLRSAGRHLVGIERVSSR